jgi:hypothetical protein
LPRRRRTFAEVAKHVNNRLPGSPSIGAVIGDHMERDDSDKVHFWHREARIRFGDDSACELTNAAADIRTAVGHATARRVKPLTPDKRETVERIALEHWRAVHSFHLQGREVYACAVQDLQNGLVAANSAAYRDRLKGAPPPVDRWKWRAAALPIAKDENAERYLLDAPDLKIITVSEALRRHRNITVRDLSRAGASPGLIAGLFQWSGMRSRVNRENVNKIIRRPGRPDRSGTTRLPLAPVSFVCWSAKILNRL